MPTYEYICQINNVEFEEVHSIKIQLEECPICKEKNLEQHKPKRLISGGSGKGTVVLTGQEAVAKAKEDVRQMRARANKDEKFLANVVGESKYHNNMKR